MEALLWVPVGGGGGGGADVPPSSPPEGVVGQREYPDTDVGSRLGMISPGVDLVMMLVVRPRTWTGIDCSG